MTQMNGGCSKEDKRWGEKVNNSYKNRAEGRKGA